MPERKIKRKKKYCKRLSRNGSITNRKDMELNKKQIERQDFVDNVIFELLQTVNPTNQKLDWDIEIIGRIRDMILSHYNFDEQEFYPFIEE
jgi:hypothetical protein